VTLARTTAGRCAAALELAPRLTFAGRAVEAVEIIDPALADRDELDTQLADALEGELVTVAYVSCSALLHGRLNLELDGRCDEMAVLGLAARAFDAAATATSATAVAEIVARALAVGRPHADPVAGGHWCLMAAVAALWSEHFDLAQRCMERMLAEARRTGSAVGMRVASGMRSVLHYRRGALPDQRPTHGSR
jgi:hypothetical protein